MGNPDLRKSKPIQTERSPMADVIVRGSATGFAQQITALEHRFAADETVAVEGTDTGPGPLSSCWLRWAPALQ